MAVNKSKLQGDYMGGLSRIICLQSLPGMQMIQTVLTEKFAKGAK